MKTDSEQIQRWILPKPINDEKIDDCPLNYTLQTVLNRRGIDLNKELNEFLTPSELPNPEDHFDQLNKATQRIIEACNSNEKIAICGDYDADGITSTVLLMEILTKLGARVEPFIPSRQDDGYGLNINMINHINNSKIKLIITVDNGISAFDAINRANELSIDLIITDHHKIPDINLNIYALIHPERSPNNSPYKYLAGVGISYLLAANICNKLDFNINITSASIFFCIGTVADMAPLKGANRKWLKEFLPTINLTNNKGIISIINKLPIDKSEITSEDIGYRIAPLINSVGRIGDPKLIVDLLTNDSTESIGKLTIQCIATNKERKRITALIEQDALEMASGECRSDNKFLVLSKREWHPGIIGIVAARLAEKFNLPTALLAIANDGKFRGSIRSNNKLRVNKALDECRDLLIAYGGHSSAAGFSINEENIPKLKQRLNDIAKREFKNIELSKSIKPDAYLSFKDININFYHQLCLLGPFGISNSAPIFWTRKCRILDIYKLKGEHLKMTLDDGSSSLQAIKWNSTIPLKVNDLIDVAFHIEINKWKKFLRLQLNLIDIKKYSNVVKLQLHNQNYLCQLTDNKNVLVTNETGKSFSSDLSISSENLNKRQVVFAKRILTFAEIALGKVA